METTLIIGIGGTGMKVGHILKSLYMDYDPKSLESGKIKYLFIENDLTERKNLNNYILNKNVYNSQDVIAITDFNPAYTIVNIREKAFGSSEKKLSQLEEDIYSWLDLKREFPNTVFNSGLNANRQLGRLALAENYNSVKVKIKEVIDNLTQLKKDGKSLDVYIVTGIAGGTGSSMFLDISAMIDTIGEGLGNISKKAVFVNIQPYLELKENGGFNKTSSEYKNIQINAVSLMKECEFFIKNKAKFPGLFRQYICRPSEAIGSESVIYSPYDTALFFDKTVNTGQRIPSFVEFYRTIGNILFYTLTSQSNKTFKSSVEVNVFDRNEQNFKYNTIAYKIIRFPKEEFQEYFEARFMYDLFNDRLLNRKYKVKDIEIEVDEFVKSNFSSDITSNILGSSISLNEEIKSNSDYKYLTEIISIGEFSKDTKRTLEAQELAEVFNAHEKRLNSLEASIMNLIDSKINMINFNKTKPPTESPEFKIQNLFDKQFYHIVVKYGYYGLIGISEEKKAGFIDILDKRLKSLFLEYSNEFQKLSSPHSIELEKLKKKIFRYEGKKIEKVQNDIYDYINTLKDKVYFLIDKYLKKIYLKLLYEISAADDAQILNNSPFPEYKSTLLNKLREEKEIAVGVKPTTDLNIIKLFRSNNKNDNTIENRYFVHLVNKFLDSENNIFEIYLPQPLQSFIGKTSKKWKSDTILDEIYNDVIKSDIDLEKIFPGTDEENIDLLGDLGDQYQTDLKEDLTALQEKAKEYFSKKFIENTSSRVSEFLNWNLQDAFNNADGKYSEKIKIDFDELKFPVRVSGPKPPRGETYVNIDRNLRKFIKDTFNVPDKRFIINENFGTNKVVLIQHIRDIKFEEMGLNKEAIKVYYNRNIEVFRPHLHKDWNEYPGGIDEALADLTEMDINALKNEEGSRSWSEEELFMLSYLVDLISDKLDFIFVQDEMERELSFYLAKPPIYSERGKYYFQSEINDSVEVEDEGIKFAIIDNDETKIRLPLTNSNFKFEETLNSLSSLGIFVPAMAKLKQFIFADDDTKNAFLSLVEEEEQNIQKRIMDLIKRIKIKQRTIKSEFDKNFPREFNNFVKRIKDQL